MLLGAVGVAGRMPRTPAVFAKKIKYRTLDDTEFISGKGSYMSAGAVVDVLEGQMVEEEQLNTYKRVSNEEARRLYGDRLWIAALGVIEKNGDTFRLLHVMSLCCILLVIVAWVVSANSFIGDM